MRYLFPQSSAPVRVDFARVAGKARLDGYLTAILNLSEQAAPMAGDHRVEVVDRRVRFWEFVRILGKAGVRLSCPGFDGQLIGGHGNCFVLHGGLVVQRLMEPLTIIKELHVLEDLRSGLITGLKSAMVNEFVFERAKEAFRHRIVIAVALAAHAAHHRVLFEQRQIASARV